MEDIFKVIYNFFSQFAPSYAEGVIPDDSSLPYIIYSVQIPETLEKTVLTCSVYSKSNSFSQALEISQKIADAIGLGKKLDLDGGGFIVLYQGSPFMQNVGNSDDRIRQIYFNFDMILNNSLRSVKN